MNKDTINLQSFFDSFLDHNMLYINSIDFTLFDLSKVINTENLFKEYKGLKEIDFTDFNSTLVTSIGSMFSGCSSFYRIRYINA